MVSFFPKGGKSFAAIILDDKKRKENCTANYGPAKDQAGTRHSPLLNWGYYGTDLVKRRHNQEGEFAWARLKEKQNLQTTK